jgi:hypothetical protein
MTTHMRMLSSLAFTAAALLTLSSDALARSGGMGGGGGGMRSFSVARTPIVVSRVRPTSTTAAARSRMTSATSHTNSSGTKTSHAKVNHCKKGCDSRPDSKTTQSKTNPDSGSQGNSTEHHKHRHHHQGPTPLDSLQSLLGSASQGTSGSQAVDPNASQGVVSQGTVSQGQGTGGQGSGGTVRRHRNVEDRDHRNDSSSPADDDTTDSANPNSDKGDGNGARPPQAPTQELIGSYPVAGNIDQGGGGSGGTGSTSKERPIGTSPIEAQTVSTGIAATPAPAPVAVDPPGCIYERSVRKAPGGGLQRVIFKICPDA